MDLEGKEAQGIDEVHLPCRVLKTSMELGYVVPSAWNGFCKRRTSWYSKSKRAGKFLIVSNKPMNIPDCNDPITVLDTNFKPHRLPDLEEIFQLAKSKEFQRKKPRIWNQGNPIEMEFYQRWFERYRTNEPFDFDKILLRHSANHANFIDPKFSVKVNGEEAPYSISDSIHVCSSCLEFFNILGEQWPVKYVVPCMGAVQFAHLPIDQYFEVRIQRENDNNKNKD
jgi:hypothetical protein